jgi:hypothetical protein
VTKLVTRDHNSALVVAGPSISFASPPRFVQPEVDDFDHVWWWRSRLPERKGQRCRVTARGSLNSIRVEFEDGFEVVTSRWAIRRPA